MTNPLRDIMWTFFPKDHRFAVRPVEVILEKDYVIIRWAPTQTTEKALPLTLVIQKRCFDTDVVQMTFTCHISRTSSRRKKPTREQPSPGARRIKSTAKLMFQATALKYTFGFRTNVTDMGEFWILEDGALSPLKGSGLLFDMFRAWITRPEESWYSGDTSLSDDWGLPVIRGTTTSVDDNFECSDVCSLPFVPGTANVVGIVDFSSRTRVPSRKKLIIPTPSDLLTGQSCLVNSEAPELLSPQIYTWLTSLSQTQYPGRGITVQNAEIISPKHLSGTFRVITDGEVRSPIDEETGLTCPNNVFTDLFPIYRFDLYVCGNPDLPPDDCAGLQPGWHIRICVKAKNPTTGEEYSLCNTFFLFSPLNLPFNGDGWLTLLMNYLLNFVVGKANDMLRSFLGSVVLTLPPAYRIVGKFLLIIFDEFDVKLGAVVIYCPGLPTPTPTLPNCPNGPILSSTGEPCPPGYISFTTNTPSSFTMPNGEYVDAESYTVELVSKTVYRLDGYDSDTEWVESCRFSFYVSWNNNNNYSTSQYFTLACNSNLAFSKDYGIFSWTLYQWIWVPWYASYYDRVGISNTRYQYSNGSTTRSYSRKQYPEQILKTSYVVTFNTGRVLDIGNSDPTNIVVRTYKVICYKCNEKDEGERPRVKPTPRSNPSDGNCDWPTMQALIGRYKDTTTVSIEVNIGYDRSYPDNGIPVTAYKSPYENPMRIDTRASNSYFTKWVGNKGYTQLIPLNSPQTPTYQYGTAPDGTPLYKPQQYLPEGSLYTTIYRYQSHTGGVTPIGYDGPPAPSNYKRVQVDVNVVTYQFHCGPNTQPPPGPIGNVDVNPDDFGGPETPPPPPPPDKCDPAIWIATLIRLDLEGGLDRLIGKIPIPGFPPPRTELPEPPDPKYKIIIDVLISLFSGQEVGPEDVRSLYDLLIDILSGVIPEPFKSIFEGIWSFIAVEPLWHIAGTECKTPVLTFTGEKTLLVSDITLVIVSNSTKLRFSILNIGPFVL